MTEVCKSPVLDLAVFRLRPFRDHRGRYVCTYDEHIYENELGCPIHFVEDDISFSSYNVLRGIHADSAAWKLVSCPLGKIELVIVDCRREESSFGRHELFEIGEANPLQVLVPPGFGVAHLVLQPILPSAFLYKQSERYDLSRQCTYRWDDPRFGIKWSTVLQPTLSDRDAEAQFV